MACGVLSLFGMLLRIATLFKASMKSCRIVILDFETFFGTRAATPFACTSNTWSDASIENGAAMSLKKFLTLASGSSVPVGTMTGKIAL